MKTNARLLKQSSEKDDMNAKSLSTILHLKQRNEELQTLSAKLKEKSSSAQQLALAARLAANAKDRVGEEAVKEKEALEEVVKQLKEECESLRKKRNKWTDFYFNQRKALPQLQKIVMLHERDVMNLFPKTERKKMRRDKWWSH